MCSLPEKFNANPTTRTVAVVLGIIVIATGSAVQAGPLPPKYSEQDLPASARAQPILVYNRLYTGAVYADYVPGESEVRAPFSPTMAGNEYEPMQVGLYVPASQPALQDITLEVSSPLPCEVGHIFYMPPDEMSWLADDQMMEGKSWHTPDDPKLYLGRRVNMPLYVLPVARIAAIKPGHSAAFWLTFKTNERSAAGEHAGTFTVRSAGQSVAQVKFTIHVRPFVLPRPKIHYGMYYRPYQTPPAFRGLAFQEQYLADMAAHGMNFMDMDLQTSLLSQDGYGLDSSTPLAPPEANAHGSRRTRSYLDNYFRPEDYQPDGGFNALKLFDRQFILGLEAGLIQRDHPIVAFQDGWILDAPAKASAFATIENYRRGRNWPHYWMYMRDEPGPNVFAEVIKHVGQWQRLGVPGIAAMNGPAGLGVGHVHRVWTVLAGQIPAGLLREADRLGAEVWTYDFNLRTTNVEAHRFFAGLYTWSLGLKGNMPYAYMGEVNHQPYFDADWHLSGPSILGVVIPSPVGPVPGVGFEGRREGVDDARYLQLLEARASGASANNAVAHEASAWLHALAQEIRTNQLETTRLNAWGTDFLDPHQGFDPDDYDQIRARASQLIMKLPPAAGELNPEPEQWVRPTVPLMEAESFIQASMAECLAALNSGSVAAQRQAAAALALRDPEEALPTLNALIKLLDEPDARIVALRALANFGPAAAPAIANLRSLLDDEDGFVRIGATYVLTMIGPDAVEALNQCTHDPEPYVANLARETLANWRK